MEYQTKSISIASRIAWCRGQKTQALTQLEREGWQAEEDGLEDAVLNTRYNEKQYQDYPPCVFERYVMGFHDGQTLIHAAGCGLTFPNPLPDVRDTCWGSRGTSKQ